LQEKDLGDEQERDFDPVEHEEPHQHFTRHGVDIIDLEAQDLKTVKDMVIKEQEAKIQSLSDDLERIKFIIRYLEQENKQLSDKQILMELQMIKENRQKVKEAHVNLTSIKQEIENDRENWLERVNIHLKGLIEKANRDKKMLRHMAYHYLTRNKICNIRIKKLKARLRKALKRKRSKIS